MNDTNAKWWKIRLSNLFYCNTLNYRRVQSDYVISLLQNHPVKANKKCDLFPDGLPQIIHCMFKFHRQAHQLKIYRVRSSKMISSSHWSKTIISAMFQKNYFLEFLPCISKGSSLLQGIEFWFQPSRVFFVVTVSLVRYSWKWFWKYLVWTIHCGLASLVFLIRLALLKGFACLSQETNKQTSKEQRRSVKLKKISSHYVRMGFV